MNKRTSIIGAGLAGAVCAADLGSVREVVVFEREPHAGGRIAACRRGGFEFDCGAPYFMATGPALRDRVEYWINEGIAARWDGWAVELYEGNLLTRDLGADRYVGMPNMAELAVRSAAEAELRLGVQVLHLEREANGWWLKDRIGRRHGPFDEVVCALPPAETAQLLESCAPALAQRAQGVAMRPRWVVMMGFERPVPVPFDDAYLEGSILAWCGRNNSKPGHDPREAWTLLASPEWSEAQANAQEGAVIGALSRAFASVVEGAFTPTVSLARHWRAAEPINPLGEPFLADAGQGLYACGDWCLAPRMDGAFLSAAALATALRAGAG